jgi:hypothetical protein
MCRARFPLTGRVPRSSGSTISHAVLLIALKGDPHESSRKSTRTTKVRRQGSYYGVVTGQAHGLGSGVLDQTGFSTHGDRRRSRPRTVHRGGGASVSRADFNFWGVTFGRDSNVFYATLKTSGTAFLVRGDLALRKLTVLRENVECPSLSPDNRLIAFKKKVGGNLAPWRFSVLDLATLVDRPIAAKPDRSTIDRMARRWAFEQIIVAIPTSTPSRRSAMFCPGLLLRSAGTAVTGIVTSLEAQSPMARQHVRCPAAQPSWTQRLTSSEPDRFFARRHPGKSDRSSGGSPRQHRSRKLEIRFTAFTLG